jgi:hypothetical protein
MEDLIPILFFVVITVGSLLAGAYQKRMANKQKAARRPRHRPEPEEPYIVLEPEPEPEPQSKPIAKPLIEPEPLPEPIFDVDDAIDVDHADERIGDAVDDAVIGSVEKIVEVEADAIGRRAEALGRIREAATTDAYALPTRKRASWSPAKLRQAVIMTEVLGKPVSRRPRNLRGRPRSGVHLDFGGTGQGARGTGW